MSTAERMRKYRARRRLGQAVLPLRVNECALVEKLVEAGLLPQAIDYDRAAFIGAAERLLETIAKEKTT